MKNKILSSDIQLNYLREQRKYLHSTDIVEGILFLNKDKFLSNLNISFKKPIFSESKIIIQNKFSETLKLNSSLYFEYEIKKKQFFGFLIEIKKKLKKRKTYNEAVIKKKTNIKKNIINVPYLKEFNFIELVVGSAMKFLKKKSPEHRSKWYIAKIHLFLFSYKKLLIKKNLTLKSDKIKSTIYNLEIYLKKKKIGSMIFIKT